jgi:hypothetical protein
MVLLKLFLLETFFTHTHTHTHTHTGGDKIFIINPISSPHKNLSIKCPVQENFVMALRCLCGNALYPKQNILLHVQKQNIDDNSQNQRAHFVHPTIKFNVMIHLMTEQRSTNFTVKESVETKAKVT